MQMKRPSPARAAAVLVVLALAALPALGCGSRAGGTGSGTGTPPPPPPPQQPLPVAAKAYPAARWIPARPTYAIAARSVGDAQNAAADLLGSIGALVGIDTREGAQIVRGVLGIDALAAEALTEIGIDLDGSMAVFSEAVSPTLVVHLAAPAKARAFVDRLRAGGMEARPEQVDGLEVLTVALPAGVRVSWAIAGEWLWIHTALPLAPDDGTAWLTASRKPGAPTWDGTWQWAITSGGQGERPALLGFFDLRALLASLSPRLPAALACTKLVEPVGRVAVAFEAGAGRLGGRVALEIGGAAPGVQRAVLPAPAGWTGVAGGAPFAAQWNLDLAAVRAALAPCAQALAVDLSVVDRYGVRTARAILHRYDPGKPTNSRGVVSMDLAHKKYAAQLLDEVPGRSLIERKRTFGPYQGRVLSIPFGGPTVEYVLDEQRALVGLGEGMLAPAVGAGPGGPGPILAIDIAPPAMSREAWAGLLGMMNLSPDALLAWRELHLAITVDGDRLVLDASGRRR
jgi:hypothetical protein